MDAAHQVGGSEAAHGHRRRGLEGNGTGQLDQRRSRHQALGAVGAEGVDEAGVGHAVAQGDVVHALAHRHHHAGSLDADAIGQGNRVGAVAEVGIGVVQTYGDVANTYLTRARISDLDLFIAKYFRSPGFIKTNGFGHACLQSGFL
ncbi:hypothetical protein D9M71_233160 [compost metagenome]